MQTIWKFPLEITDEQKVTVPWGAEPLTVQMQGGQLCLWVKVNTANKPTVSKTIYIHGTGYPIPDEVPDCPDMYLGSVQDGPFVWHVFMEWPG